MPRPFARPLRAPPAREMPLFRKNPPPSRERTVAERERERLDRERRRAERGGRPFDESLLTPRTDDGTGDMPTRQDPGPPSDAEAGGSDAGRHQVGGGDPDGHSYLAAQAESPGRDKPECQPGVGEDAVGAPEADPGGHAVGAPEADPGGHAVGAPEADPGEHALSAPEADPGEHAVGAREADPGGHAVGAPEADPGEHPAAADPGELRDAGPGAYAPQTHVEPAAPPEGSAPGAPHNGLPATGISPLAHEHDEPAHDLGDPVAHPEAHEDLPAPVAVDTLSDVPLPVAASPPPRGERLPPPPSRRDSLLERRERRMRQQRARHREVSGVVTRGRVGAVIVVLLIGALVWFALSLLQPTHGSARGQVFVTVPRGANAGQVGSLLARDGVVSSGFFFNVRATLDGKRGDLHPGTFRLQRDMSYAAAIDALSRPPPAAVVVRVTIPEGKSRSAIAALAATDGLSGDYRAASLRSPLLDPRRYGAPRHTQSLEGFLFPATYQLKVGSGVARLVAEQLTAFRRNFGHAEVALARRRRLTPYELLTVASMVEDEAQVSRDRPLIAAVIYNRLRDGMPLGIDATIRYAIGGNFSRPLTESDLHIASPFNTRTHAGLPPTPIGNPGLASIAAAAHPARVPYLYYVAAADGCGEHSFSSSYAQFLRDSAAYQAAVRANGGHAPACRAHR